MFFFPNHLGCPYRTRSHITSGKILLPAPFKHSKRLANLLRLSLLGIYTGELVSSYFDYCISFFIHILKWVRLNYAITHHHPAPPTTIYHYPPPAKIYPPRLTTTHHQPKYVHYHSPPLTTTHYHSPPRTTTHHQPKYIHIHPRPAKMYPPSFTTTHRQPRFFL